MQENAGKCGNKWSKKARKIRSGPGKPNQKVMNFSQHSGTKVPLSLVWFAGATSEKKRKVETSEERKDGQKRAKKCEIDQGAFLGLFFGHYPGIT